MDAGRRLRGLRGTAPAGQVAPGGDDERPLLFKGLPAPEAPEAGRLMALIFRLFFLFALAGVSATLTIMAFFSLILGLLKCP